MTNPKQWPFPVGPKPEAQHVTVNLSDIAKELSDQMGIFPGAEVKTEHPKTYKLEHISGTTFNEIETDPNGKALNSPGAKADAGKVLPWLFQTGFAHALHEVARVTTLGARKYTPNGWSTVPDGQNRYMEAFARHTSYLAMGEVFDDSPTGLGPDIYHKAQMIWNLLASLELEIRENNSTDAS